MQLLKRGALAEAELNQVLLLINLTPYCLAKLAYKQAYCGVWCIFYAHIKSPPSPCPPPKLPPQSNNYSKQEHLITTILTRVNYDYRSSLILSGMFGVCGQFSAAGIHTLFDSDTESETSKVAQLFKSCAYVAYKLLSALYDVLSVSVQCYRLLHLQVHLFNIVKLLFYCS